MNLQNVTDKINDISDKQKDVYIELFSLEIGKLTGRVKQAQDGASKLTDAFNAARNAILAADAEVERLTGFIARLKADAMDALDQLGQRKKQVSDIPEAVKAIDNEMIKYDRVILDLSDIESTAKPFISKITALSSKV